MKYYSKKVRCGGHTFDSKKEAERYLELLQMQKHGKIHGLKLQECFELLPKQTKTVEVRLKTKVKQVERVDEMAVNYHCDFFYHDSNSDKWIIEDVKSPATAKVRDYPLRRKLVKLMVRRMNEQVGYEAYEFRELIVK